MDDRLVILYGESLLLAGLETCLKDHPGFSVMRIGTHPDHALTTLQALRPDTIIFDTNDPSTHDWNAIVGVLRNHSSASMIGLDVNTDDLIVLSNQPHAGAHLDDLVATIRAQLRNKPGA